MNDRAFIADRTPRQGRHDLQIARRAPLWKRLNWELLAALVVNFVVLALVLGFIAHLANRVG